MALETKRYDSADYLTDDETVYHYLAEAKVGSDERHMAHALNAVARARGGVEQLATEVGLSTDEMLLAIDPDQPDVPLLLKAIESLEVRLSASVAA
jgi:probable addiction module antidote protein